MKKIGGKLLAALGYVLVILGVIGAIQTIVFVLTNDASAYNLGFFMGRLTVLVFVLYLGYLAFKQSETLTHTNPISES